MESERLISDLEDKNHRLEAESDQLTELLDQVAGTIIYSNMHLLEPAYGEVCDLDEIPAHMRPATVDGMVMQAWYHETGWPLPATRAIANVSDCARSCNGVRAYIVGRLKRGGRTSGDGECGGECNGGERAAASVTVAASVGWQRRAQRRRSWRWRVRRRVRQLRAWRRRA